MTEAILPDSRSPNMKPSHRTNQSIQRRTLQRIQPCYLAQVQQRTSYLSTVPHLKLLDRKRRKGCLCKLSAQFQSQTHLHLPDCQSAFNFSRLRVPVPDHSLKPNVISPQMPCAKGSLMIQASVWEAIWASPVHTPAGGAKAGLFTRWCICRSFDSEESQI